MEAAPRMSEDELFKESLLLEPRGATLGDLERRDAVAAKARAMLAKQESSSLRNSMRNSMRGTAHPSVVRTSSRGLPQGLPVLTEARSPEARRYDQQ